MFFSWFELGSIVLVALPVQTSCFVPGSYMSRTRVPTLIVELVHDPEPMPKAREPQASHFLSSTLCDLIRLHNASPTWLSHALDPRQSTLPFCPRSHIHAYSSKSWMVARLKRG